MSKTCAIFQYSDSILSELLSFIDTLSEEHDKSMEEAAEEYVTTHLRNNEFPTADSAFIAGAEWQKEQMMKGAVEGNVIICYLAGDGTQYGNIVSTDIDVDSHNLNEGDKIRVIIVKED